MQKRDDAALGIDEEDGAAVGDMDAQADARIYGDKAIRVRHGRRAPRIDDSDFRAVDLLRADEDAVSEPGAVTGFGVKFIKACQCGFALHFHIEPRNAPDKAVPDGGDFSERGKDLDGRHAQSAAPLA